jgi:tetratricopeptide (TPR) repeat protein
LDCQIYGLNAAGHHLTSLTFHIANTVLLFLLLQNLTARLWPSAFVALLFALHPMHVESVAWVAERKDVLSGFFFLLTLLAYGRYVELVRIKSRRRWRVYGFTLFCFALGLMSKPMLVTLPCVLLLLDYWPLRRCELPFQSQPSVIYCRLIFEKTPFFLLTAIACWITMSAQTFAIASVTYFPLTARLAHVPVAYAWYVFKLVWPVEHSLYYILHINHPAGEVAGTLLVLGCATGLFIWQARRHPYLIVGWLWFLVMLVPVVGIVQAGNQAYAERYTYLPYIGLCLCIAWGVPELFARWSLPKPLLWCAAIFILLACGKLTVAQVHVWKRADTLFQQAVDLDNKNEVAWALSGLSFNHNGNTDRAIECLRQAIAINPLYHEAWYYLGRMLVIKGKYDEAQGAFETALVDGRQQKPLIHKSLGDLFIRIGKTKEAITNLEESLALQPDQPEVNTMLGKAYLAEHQTDLATSAFEKALRLYRDDPEAEMGLAMLCGEAGQNAEAMVHYRRVIEIEPNSENALNNLAWLLATTPDARLRNGPEAVRFAERACKLTHDEQAFFIGTLAAAYAEAGKFEQAVATAQRAYDVALAHGQKAVAVNNQHLMESYKSGQAFHGEATPKP